MVALKTKVVSPVQRLTGGGGGIGIRDHGARGEKIRKEGAKQNQGSKGIRDMGGKEYYQPGADPLTNQGSGS